MKKSISISFLVIGICVLLAGQALALDTVTNSTDQKTVTAIKPSPVLTQTDLNSQNVVKTLSANQFLLKDKNSPKIYLQLDKNVISPIADLATLKKLTTKTTKITTVSNLVTKYQIGAPITSAQVVAGLKPIVYPSIKPVNLNYQLIKTVSDPTIYLIDKCNELRAINNPQTIKDLQFNQANIKTVTPDVLKNFQSGPAITDSNLNVQYQGDAAVYQKTANQFLPSTPTSTNIAPVKPCNIIQLPPRVVPMPVTPIKPTPTPLPITPGKPVNWTTSMDNFIDNTLYAPPDLGYGYGLAGANKGFVALKNGQSIIYRGLNETIWQTSQITATTLKDSLTACQKYYPGTYLAQAISNYNFDAWIKYSGLPQGQGWVLYGCLVPPASSDFSNSVDLLDQGQPKISAWWGKLNQVMNPLATTASVGWVSDPDGVSGASLDTLAYCQKWFGSKIQSVQYLGNRYGLWDTRNFGTTPYKGGGSVFECRTTPQPSYSMPPTSNQTLPEMPPTNVQQTNDKAPMAISENYLLLPNTPLTISLKASDPENNSLVYKIVSQPKYGTLSQAIGGSNVKIYTPSNENALTKDSFTFLVNDGYLDSNIAEIDISPSALIY